MKILMLNPPFFNKFSRTSRSPGISKGGCVYYPIWLGYATGVLEQNGHKVKLVDATAASMTHREVYRIAEDFSPELIVVDSVTASFNNDVEVSNSLKEKFPDSFLMMVGDMVTAIPIEAMKASDKIDAIARGEYDFTLRDVARELKQKKDLSKVLGLNYRDRNSENRIVATPDRPPITGEELDKMKFVSSVYSRHLKIEDYFYPSVLYPEVTIITGRGCYYRCTFCVDGNTVVTIKENDTVIVDTISNIVDKLLEKNSKNVAGYDVRSLDNKELFVRSNEEWTRVANVSRTKATKSLKFYLSGGKTIQITPDHIVPVERDGFKKELKAGEIKLEDRMLFSEKFENTSKPISQINVFKELVKKVPKHLLSDVYVHNLANYFCYLKNEFKEKFKSEKKNFKTYWMQYKVLPIFEFKKLVDKFGLPAELEQELEISGKNLRPVPFILKVNKELMDLIGLFVSEGSYSQHSVVITKSDNYTRKLLINSIKTIFPKTYIITTEPSKVRGGQILFGGKLVSLLFKKVFEILGKAKNKKLPNLVFNVSEDMQKACLRALYTGDGSWDKARKIWYFTTSETLLKQVELLLTHNEINYSIAEQDMRGPAKISGNEVNINYIVYRLSIHSWDDRQKFIENIGFFGERQKELVEFQEKFKPNRVKVLEQLAGKKLSTKELAEKTNLSQANLRQTISILVRQNKIQKHLMSKQGFIKKVAYSFKQDQKILRNKTQQWLEIVGIQEVNEERNVYDFETENSYFTANGIVVHNCKWPQLLTGHSYRARSVQNLVDEFEWIKDNLSQVKDIMIEDDTLTQDRKRTMKMSEEIINRKVKIAWTCNARADLDFDVMKSMKEAGCRLMCVGFESADQQILNNIKKGTNVEKIRQFMKDSKKAKLLVHGCFMMGNNGETKETIRKTTEFAKELDPDTAQFFPVMVYPGTEGYKWAEENEFLLTKNWDEWLKPDGTHNSIVSTDKLTSKELVNACDKARIEFYLRPKFMARKLKQIILNPKDIPRTAISTLVFAKYLKKHIQNDLIPQKKSPISS